MISQRANTLYVQDDEVSLHIDHETIMVNRASGASSRIPLKHVESVVVIGAAGVSSGVLQRCAEANVAFVRMAGSGRFAYRVSGPDSGNVLLRIAQYRAHDNELVCADIARAVVAGKIRNSRALLLRAARDTHVAGAMERLRSAAAALETMLANLERREGLDEIRGAEGEAARVYFAAFSDMVSVGSDEFAFRQRSRRPPRDRMNALLSFLYALLVADCGAAIQAVGLDQQVGFLHALRPGRPSLALDLMEELRPVVADRLVLNLVNLRQVRASDFVVRPGGATLLSDDARKKVLTEYAKRKRRVVRHRWLGQDAEMGIIPHLQARLLARVLRGDMEGYVPFVAGS